MPGNFIIVTIVTIFIGSLSQFSLTKLTTLETMHFCLKEVVYHTSPSSTLLNFVLKYMCEKRLQKKIISFKLSPKLRLDTRLVPYPRWISLQCNLQMGSALCLNPYTLIILARFLRAFHKLVIHTAVWLHAKKARITGKCVGVLLITVLAAFFPLFICKWMALGTRPGCKINKSHWHFFWD